MRVYKGIIEVNFNYDVFLCILEIFFRKLGSMLWISFVEDIWILIRYDFVCKGMFGNIWRFFFKL